jgi:hypothetical protein
MPLKVIPNRLRPPKPCLPRRPLTKRWTAEDLAFLLKLSESGATVMRAASALGRPISVVQKKARDLGKPLIGVRQARAAIRAIDSQ